MKQNKRIFDEENLKRFSICLKNTRKRLGYSQESLSYKSNISLSQIARIETYKINPTISTIFKICIALEIEPKELFSEFKIQKYNLYDNS